MESTGAEPALQATAQAPPQPAAPDWQRWAELGLVVLIAIVPSIFGAFVALFNSASPGSFRSNLGLVSGFLREGSSFLLVIYVLARRRCNLRAIGWDFEWIDVLSGLSLAFCAFMVTGFLGSLIRGVGGAIGIVPEMRDPRVIFAGLSPSLMFLYAISSSIFEETVVRAYVTTELISLAWPVWLSTLASIVLQTSYHVYYGVAGALEISGTFIVFGLYFAKSRKLMPIILGHLFVDLVSLALNGI